MRNHPERVAALIVAWGLDATAAPFVPTETTIIATGAVIVCTVMVWLDVMFNRRSLWDVRRDLDADERGYKRGLHDRDDPGPHRERVATRRHAADGAVVVDLRRRAFGDPGGA